jgi:hypothetical protein
MTTRNDLDKVYTSCCGFVYKTNGVRWATALFEKIERWRLHLPKDTPIPTHVFSIVKIDGVLYAAEAVFNEFRVEPLSVHYPEKELKRITFFESVPPFTLAEQEIFAARIDHIKKTTKGYDVLGYLAQILHILFGINIHIGKGDKYVYCNEAHEYGVNAARPNSFPHPWNDNPLELQLSPLMKKVIQ